MRRLFLNLNKILVELWKIAAASVVKILVLY
jgi:hypothetical protein